ncbi:MAG: penicillin-binding protein 2 [Firmicutes bacterium]|nr:penicillin-binding protein 2 [Bacillota bacterium]
MAAEQHGHQLLKNQLRGGIYDRNGKLLRSSTRKWYLLVENTGFKYGKEFDESLDFLSNFHSEARANLDRAYWVYSKPLNRREISRILAMGNRDLKIIANLTGRDQQEKTAWHVLGMILQEEARSGLEYTLEPVLKQPSFAASVKSLTDGMRRPLPGLGLRSVELPNPHGYFLTIDYSIQKTVETVLDQGKICGAIVVLDAKNGDILAMASRPMVDLNNLGESLKDPESPFINRAITAYPPGSIFKTVLLCAGLDSGVISGTELFRDQGYIDIGENRWNCPTSDGKGHGLLNLTEAFAYSCNPVFIELALRLNPVLIGDYAEKFGFGRPLNIGLGDETWGEVPSGIGLSLGERANLALGQQLISATPLQVASLIQTIANDGLRFPPRLIKAKIAPNGEIIELPHSEPVARVIKPETAYRVKKMMAAVLEYGTGREAQPLCKAAGKTGTVQNKEGMEHPDHAWFAGYAPLHAPRYAVVVFCEKGVSGGKTAGPIFRELVDKITSL